MKHFEHPKVNNLKTLQSLTKEQAASVAAGNSSDTEEFAKKIIATAYVADDRPPHGGGRPPFN